MMSFVLSGDQKTKTSTNPDKEKFIERRLLAKKRTIFLRWANPGLFFIQIILAASRI